jgi:hypothetical protein
MQEDVCYALHQCLLRFVGLLSRRQVKEMNFC